VLVGGFASAGDVYPPDKLGSDEVFKKKRDWKLDYKWGVHSSPQRGR